MPVGNKDVAIGSDDDGRGLVEGVRAIAGNAGLAEFQQDFAIRAELDHLLALAVRAIGVGHPDVAILVDVNAVRENEQSGAKALQKIAGRIEFENGSQV